MLSSYSQLERSVFLVSFDDSIWRSPEPLWTQLETIDLGTGAVNEQNNQNRQTADEDFRRSLTQLEDLLVDQVMLSQAMFSQDSAIAPTPPSLAQTDTQTDDQPATSESNHPNQAHRFGGTLLDAIPLAQRLAQRLATQPKTDPNPSSTETK